MQFIQDMIHLTQGEFFIKYWWIWLILVTVAVYARIYDRAKENRNKRKE